MTPAIARFVGVPYVDMGRDPAIGLDCWGVVKAVREQVYGLATPDYREQCRADQPDRHGLIDACARDWEAVTDPQPGDVVLLRIGSHVRHAGVVVSTAPLQMLSSTDDVGSAIERLDSPRWATRIAGYYRQPCEVTIQVYPQPLRADYLEAKAPAGSSLAQLLGNAAGHYRVSVNGVEIPREQWPRVKPKAGTRVTAHAVPQRVFRRILGALLGVISFITKPLLKLLAPPVPSAPGVGDSFNRRTALTGTRNNVAPYEVVPNVYGRMRFYPPFAALPFTEQVGDTQYLRVLLMLGYGPLTVSDIRIGTTPISSFQGVEVEIGSAPSLFANDVSEETLAVELNDPASTVTRTTALGVDEFSFDLAFPQGLYSVDDRNRTRLATVRFSVEYRAAGSGGAWINPVLTGTASFSAGWISVPGGDYAFACVGMVRETRMAGIRVKPGARGQYEVRISRQNTVTEIGSPTITAADCQLIALRGVTYTVPSAVPNTLLLAMRIKSTDQLNGVTDRINVLAQRALPVWSGSAWVTQATRSPAWAFVDVLTGIATERAVDRNSRLALAEIIDWAAECTTRGRTFDAVIDSRTTVFELARDIASVGRASISQRDGRFTVIQDQAISVPVQWFTPRNSQNFEAEISLEPLPHAVRVRFVNPDLDYQQDEIIVPDTGYTEATATRFETLQLRGVTSPQQAWLGGKYFLAQNRLRRTNYTLTCDVENLVARRGDLVGVASDVIGVGLGSGRVTRVVLNGSSQAIEVEIDEFVTLQAGRTYAVRIRRNIAASVVSQVSAVVGTVNRFTLVTPLGGVNVGDLAMVGELNSETRLCRVVSQDPGPDLTATLTLVDDAPELLETQNLTPPAFPPRGDIVVDPALIQCCPRLPTLDSGGTAGTPPTSAPGGSTSPVIRVSIP